jgi:tetratricopeptide (TPR) repeat protein
MPSPEILYFIQPHVIERVISGQFIAKRDRTNKPYALRDRRNNLSPLNVTRRAIRYEPMVFRNQSPLILSAANALNTPHIKLLQVLGPHARGKTAFTRALIELMGGGPEQLIWFDVGRHTDFDELIRFLIASLVSLLSALQELEEADTRYTSLNALHPLQRLEALLTHAKTFPILIVIDNLEFLLHDTQQALKHKELKEAFNFLLGFSNIKLMLLGQAMPVQDLLHADKMTHIVDLNPLTEEQSIFLFTSLLPEQNRDDELIPLIALCHGEPGLLQIFSKIWGHLPRREGLIDYLASETLLERALVKAVLSDASPETLHLMVFLANIRHGFTHSMIETLCSKPASAILSWKVFMKEGVLRFFLKKVYPPQLVLQRLENRKHASEGDDVVEAFYQLSERFSPYFKEALLTTSSFLPQVHERLYQFYEAERQKRFEKRIYVARSRHLAGEASYHLDQKKALRKSTAQPPASIEKPSASQPILPPKHSELYPFLRPLEETSSPQALDPELAALLHSPQEDSRHPIETVRLNEDDLEKLATLIQTEKTIPRESSAHTINPLENQQVTALKTSVSQFQLPENLPLEALPWQRQLYHAEEMGHTALICTSLIQLGKALYPYQRHQEVEQLWLKALKFSELEKLSEPQFKALSLLGHLYYSEFQHNKALDYLKRAQHLAPQCQKINPRILARVHIDLAEIARYRKQYTQAVQSFDEAFSLLEAGDSVKSDIALKRALTYDESGDFTSAMAAYALALSITPNQALILYNMTCCLFEHAQYAEALETLTQVLKASEKDHAIFIKSILLKIQVLQALGQLAEAQVVALEAFTLLPEHTPDQLKLASIIVDLACEQDQYQLGKLWIEKLLSLGATLLTTESKKKLELRYEHCLEALKSPS